VVITPALRQGAGSTPDGREWIARLPALVAAAVARWDLRLGAPFTSGRSSWCAPAALGEHAGGADLVLKISFPHEEAATEAAVLRAWAGHGAVGLVDAHAADWALLLRRVRPGTPLRAARTPVDRRLAEAAAVVRRLAAAPAPDGLPALHDVTAAWADLVEERADRAARAGHRIDPALVRDTLGTQRAPAVAHPVVLHGDLNPGNVLRGPDPADPWIAIDPKAMSGDPAYDLTPLLEQVADPWRTTRDPVATLTRRTALLAGHAGVDASAAACWGLARTLDQGLWAWSHRADPRLLRAAERRARTWAAVRDRL
jgi:streptomycin 6-kinase